MQSFTGRSPLGSLLSPPEVAEIRSWAEFDEACNQLSDGRAPFCSQYLGLPRISPFLCLLLGLSGLLKYIG
jgi:hypothetical protein